MEQYELQSVMEFREAALKPRSAWLQRLAKGDPDQVTPWDSPHHMHLWDWFPPLFNCFLKARLGRFGDGGKVVCNIHELSARGSACTMLSFGVRDDISFEIDVAARTRCTIHAFDPTVDRLPMPRDVPLNVSGRFRFHRIGLSAERARHANGRPLDTLQALMTKVGVRHVHLLKVDVEGAEWAAFRQMGQAGTLRSVDQLMIELHFAQASLACAPEIPCTPQRHVIHLVCACVLCRRVCCATCSPLQCRSAKMPAACLIPRRRRPIAPGGALASVISLSSWG